MTRSSESALTLVTVDLLSDGGVLNAAWDNLVANSSSSGFMQSTSWAAFKRKQRYRIHHQLLLSGDELIGGAVCYAAPPRFGAPSDGSVPNVLQPGLLNLPEGPVLPWQNVEFATEGMRLIVQSIKDLAAQHQVVGARIEPRLAPPNPPPIRMFKRAPVDLLPSQTLCIDLSQSESELFSQFHHKCRYNIRLSALRGVTVREESKPAESLIRSSYNLMAQASQRDDFFLEPLSFFVELFESLPASMVSLFIAEQDHLIIGALVLIKFGRRATYLYGAVGNAKRNLMAGYALQWQAICAAKSAGCSEYDLYGFVSPGKIDHPYARFSQFKQRFGGHVERFVGAHDYYFVDRLADVVAGALNEVSFLFEHEPESGNL